MQRGSGRQKENKCKFSADSRVEKDRQSMKMCSCLSLGWSPRAPEEDAAEINPLLASFLEVGISHRVNNLTHPISSLKSGFAPVTSQYKRARYSKLTVGLIGAML